MRDASLMKWTDAEIFAEAEARKTEESNSQVQVGQPATNAPQYDAVCSECKQACKVPFKPREGWALYCPSCFQKRRGRL